MKPKDKIRTVRLKEKLTQKQLAELTGLTQATITKLETGTTLYPSIDVAFKIAEVLKEDVYTLFGDEYKRTPLPKSVKFELEKIKNQKIILLINHILSELSHASLLLDLSHNEKLSESERSIFRSQKENIQNGLLTLIKSYKDSDIIDDNDIQKILKHNPGFILWQNFVAPLKKLL